MDSVKEKLVELLCKMISQTITVGEQADFLIANGVTVLDGEDNNVPTKWISVKDRLPEESDEYLAYCGEYGGICVLYCKVMKTKIKWLTNWKKVTHWMPLPQPPKGE